MAPLERDTDAEQVRIVCRNNAAAGNVEALLGMRQSPLLLGGPDRLLAALTGLGCSVRDDSVCPAADGCPKAAAISVDAPVGCPSFGSAVKLSCLWVEHIGQAAAGCSKSIVRDEVDSRRSSNMVRKMEQWLMNVLIMPCNAGQSATRLQQAAIIQQASGGTECRENAHPLMASGILSISF